MNKFKSVLLSLCVSATMVSAETLEWTSGQLGGSWYTMSAGIASIIEENNKNLLIKVVPGGGVTNPSKIEKGKSKIGLSLAPLAYLAMKGQDVYAGNEHKNVYMIGQSLMDIKFQFIRAKDAKFDDIGNLLKNGKNQKIGVTKVGSSDEKIFSWMMKYYGTSYKDLKKRGNSITFANVNELSSQFKDRMIDYAAINTGAPSGSIIDMLISRDGEISELPIDLRKELSTKYSLLETTLEKGLYKGQDKNALTSNSATVLLVSKKVSEKTVYNITKAICENQANLPDIHISMKVFDCKNATLGNPVPIHPGSMKYYKEMGYVK